MVIPSRYLADYWWLHPSAIEHAEDISSELPDSTLTRK